MEKWRKIIITILLFPFLLGIGLFVGLLFWLSLGISVAIPALIIIWLISRERKPKPAPATPTSATPATPSGGWKSWAAIIVILAVLGIAGYLLAANWDTINGYLPASPLAKEQLTTGCSAAVITDVGYEYIIKLDENGYSGFGGCDPFRENKTFSLEAVKGKVKFWDGKTTSEFNASGIVDPQSSYKQLTAESLPLGVLLVGVDDKPYLELGSKKIFFKTTKDFLEAYDKKDNGTLLRKIPVTLPSQPGGWSSQLKLMQNARCWEKAANKPVCTATFEVRQIYYTK